MVCSMRNSFLMAAREISTSRSPRPWRGTPHRRRAAPLPGRCRGRGARRRLRGTGRAVRAHRRAYARAPPQPESERAGAPRRPAARRPAARRCRVVQLDGSNELRWSESVQRSVGVVGLRRSLPVVERLGAAEQVVLRIRRARRAAFVDAVERVVLAHRRRGSERVGEAGPGLRDKRIIRVCRRRHRWQGFRHRDPVAPEPDLVAVRQHEPAIRRERSAAPLTNTPLVLRSVST